MNTLLEGGEQLERELTPEPLLRAGGGLVCASWALAGSLVLYGVLERLLSSRHVGRFGSRRSDPGEPGEQCAAAARRSAQPECAGYRDSLPGARCSRSQGAAGRRRDGDSDPGKQQEAQACASAKEPAAPAAAQAGQPRPVWRAGGQRRCRAPRRPRPLGTHFGQRRRLRQPVRMVCGRINRKMATSWYKRRSGPAHAARGARVY